MKKILSGLLIFALPLAALTEQHEGVAAEVLAATKEFNDAYASNDLDTYFGLYADDALLIFDQERSSVADYNAMWHGLIDAGGGVQSVEMSDIQVRVLSGQDVVAVSYRAKTATRNPDGNVEVTESFETDLWEKREEGWKVVLLHFNYLRQE